MQLVREIRRERYWIRLITCTLGESPTLVLTLLHAHGRVQQPLLKVDLGALLEPKVRRVLRLLHAPVEDGLVASTLVIGLAALLRDRLHGTLLLRAARLQLLVVHRPVAWVAEHPVGLAQHVQAAYSELDVFLGHIITSTVSHDLFGFLDDLTQLVLQ